MTCTANVNKKGAIHLSQIRHARETIKKFNGNKSFPKFTELHRSLHRLTQNKKNTTNM